MSLRFDDNVERTIEDEKKEGEEDEKEEEGGEEEEEEKEIPKVLLQHSYAENTQHSEILEEKEGTLNSFIRQVFSHTLGHIHDSHSMIRSNSFTHKHSEHRDTNSNDSEGSMARMDRRRRRRGGEGTK